MKFLKKYNESTSVHLSRDIDDFLLKVKDEFANISDEYEVQFEWENAEDLSHYKIELEHDYGTYYNGDKLPFYINIFIESVDSLENRYKKNGISIIIDELETMLKCYKKVRHLINTSDIKFEMVDNNKNSSPVTESNNVIKIITWCNI